MSNSSIRIYAAKPCIHILVVRLEPVAECGSQHASGRARRAAFHDEVLSIEKVCRVSAVKRKRLESLEGRENRRGPLPSIADHAIHAERAAALRMGIHRCGI